MDSKIISTQVSVKNCYLCQGDTEYYCYGCRQDLCIRCKKLHVIDLRTKNHKVTCYLEKMKYPPKLIVRSKNPLQVKQGRSEDQKQGGCSISQDYNNLDACGISVCDPCPEYKSCIFLTNEQMSFLKGSMRDEKERQQYSEMIYYLRNENIYYKRIVLEGLWYDLKTGHKAVIIRGQSKAVMRGQELKDLIDKVLAGDLEDRCIIQKTRMTRHMTKLMRYYHRFEQLSETMETRPFKFLRIMTQKHSPRKDDMRKIVSMLVNLMKGIQFVETGKRQAPGNKRLLTLMSSPLLQKFLKAKDVHRCKHISHVTPHQAWISDGDTVTLIDVRTCKTLHSVNRETHYLCQSYGSHTVNSKRELIYIDDYIRKLSCDRKTTTTFIEKEAIWHPQCLYCSPATGDILVGMYIENTGKVTRYNKDGHLKQTIPYNPTFPRIYMCPCFITENNNGDVVVSDSEGCAVVVTTGRGEYRFSYMGISPRGICTDVLSHILVCDEYTKTVHFLDKDGQFLSYLLTEKLPGINRPYSLTYDVINHCIMVGSKRKRRMAVYRFINRHLDLTDDMEYFGTSLTSQTPKSDNFPGLSQEEYDLFAAKKEAKIALKRTRQAAADVEGDATKAEIRATNIAETVANFAIKNNGIELINSVAKEDAARAIKETIAILAGKIAEEMAKIETAAESAETATTGATAKAAARIATKGAEVVRDAARKSAVAVQRDTTRRGGFYGDDYCYGMENSYDYWDYYNYDVDDDDDDDDDDYDDSEEEIYDVEKKEKG